jgi:hypothetical protein
VMACQVPEYRVPEHTGPVGLFREV